VHILHGDDFVLPGFYEKMRRATESADVAMACCRAFVVDESDAIDSLSPRIGSLESPGRDVTAFCYNNPFLTPAVVIRRSIYEAEGGFREELIHVADWDMFVRAIRLGAGLAVNEPLASYRLFAANDTSRLMRTGENLRDYLRLSEVFAAAAADFDMARFRHAVASRARGQADAARERGDLEAAEANEKVWLELVPGDNANPKSAKWFLKQFIPPGLLGLSRFLQGANGSR
jgi:hypothetical protein